MSRNYEARKLQLEGVVIRGGYNQKEVPPLYRETVDFLPERIEEIKRCFSLLPDKFNQGSAEKVNLKEATVVDLGSGPGIVTREIKDKVGRVIAVDKAPKMVSFLKDEFRASANVEALAGDMTKIPLADNSVEGIISAGTIFELPDEAAEDDFLKETMRILKPTGVLILDGISNSNVEEVNYSFNKERQQELERVKKHQGPVVQRLNVFKTDELEARLRGLGLNCRVEPFFQEENGDYCAVRITKLEKKDET